MEKKKNIHQIMLESYDNIEKLHNLVMKTMEEEALMVDRLVHPPKEMLSPGQKNIR